MQQVNSNILNMVQSVLASLNKDIANWADEPEIVAEVNDLEKKYNIATSLTNQLSGINSKGYTTTKDNLFDLIMASTLIICKRLCVYARRTNDHTTLTLANHSLNSLARGMEKDAISRCAAIVNKAESMLTVVAQYKITATDVETIRGHIADYNTSIGERSSVKTSKSVMTQDLSTVISDIRRHLEMLDDLIEGFITDSDVMARYKTARIIHDYGKSKTSRNKDDNSKTSSAS